MRFYRRCEESLIACKKNNRLRGYSNGKFFLYNQYENGFEGFTEWVEKTFDGGEKTYEMLFFGGRRESGGEVFFVNFVQRGRGEVRARILR